MKGVFIAISLIVLVYSCSLMLPASTNTSTRTSTVLINYDKTQSIIKDRLACRDVDTFSDISRLDADRDARTSFITSKMYAGDCLILHEGLEVFVTDTSWRGYAKVREKGRLQEFWTPKDALEVVSAASTPTTDSGFVPPLPIVTPGPPSAPSSPVRSLFTESCTKAPSGWSPIDPDRYETKVKITTAWAKKLRGFKTLVDLQRIAGSKGTISERALCDAKPHVFYHWRSPGAGFMLATVYEDGGIGVGITPEEGGDIVVNNFGSFMCDQCKPPISIEGRTPSWSN